MNYHDPSLTQAAPWREEFDALVMAASRKLFVWGKHDCCTFAADIVKLGTGYDPAAALRGTYSNESEAAGVLEAFGGLEALGASCGLGISPGLARVGDVGIVWDGERTLAAVCTGANWVCPGPRGLGILPLSAATHAWRVAHA